MARTWSLGLSAFPFRFMVTIQWKHLSTKQYRNQVNIVFSQLTWEKRDFLHVPRQPSAEGTWAFCSTETWPGIGEADCASKLKPHFFNTFYTLNWKTDEFEDTDENELGSRTRNPVKRAGGLAVCFHGAFNPDHNPLFPGEFPPSAGVTHSSANALCLWPRALPLV